MRDYRDEALNAAVTFRKGLTDYLGIPPERLTFLAPPDANGALSGDRINVMVSAYATEDRLGYRFTLGIALEIAPNTFPLKVVPFGIEYVKANLDDAVPILRVEGFELKLIDDDPRTLEPAFDTVVEKLKHLYENPLKPTTLSGESEKGEPN
jgi:hypothetical protein